MAFSSDIANLGEDGFADSDGVKIHYVTKGTGPLVVLIHGIPEFWYAWRNQIPELAKHFLTLVTVPKARHWVHLDAANLVTKRMVRWLTEE